MGSSTESEFTTLIVFNAVKPQRPNVLEVGMMSSAYSNQQL